MKYTSISFIVPNGILFLALLPLQKYKTHITVYVMLQISRTFI